MALGTACGPESEYDVDCQHDVKMEVSLRISEESGPGVAPVYYFLKCYEDFIRGKNFKILPGYMQNMWSAAQYQYNWLTM